MTYPGIRWNQIFDGDVITPSQLEQELKGVISNPNQFHVYNVPVQNIPSSSRKIIWNTIVIQDDIFEFSPGSTSVTINKAGVFRLNVELTLQTNSNSRTEGLSELLLNGSVIPGSLMYSYHRNRRQGTTTVSSTRIINTSYGDVVEVQSKKNSGGNLSTVSEGCRLTIEEIL